MLSHNIPREYAIIKSDYGFIPIRHQDIVYIEAMSDYVTVYTTDRKKHYTLKTMKVFLQELPDTFLRCHRSYIVNTRKIGRMQRNTLYLKEKIPKEQIPIGRAYMKTFKEQLSMIPASDSTPAVSQQILLLANGHCILLSIQDILYAEFTDDRTCIYTSHGPYSAQVTLDNLYKQLQQLGYFVQPKRLCIVNMENIVKATNRTVFVKRDKQEPVTIYVEKQYSKRFIQSLDTTNQ